MPVARERVQLPPMTAITGQLRTQRTSSSQQSLSSCKTRLAPINDAHPNRCGRRTTCRRANAPVCWQTSRASSALAVLRSAARAATAAPPSAAVPRSHCEPLCVAASARAAAYAGQQRVEQRGGVCQFGASSHASLVHGGPLPLLLRHVRTLAHRCASAAQPTTVRISNQEHEHASTRKQNNNEKNNMVSDRTRANDNAHQQSRVKSTNTPVQNKKAK